MDEIVERVGGQFGCYPAEERVLRAVERVASSFSATIKADTLVLTDEELRQLEQIWIELSVWKKSQN